MKKFKIKTWHVVALALIIVIGLSLKAVDFFNKPERKFIYDGQIYQLMLAQTPAQTFTGLSDRENLGDYDGMLFILSEKAHHTFVMRRMNFSIDIVWLNRGEVVDIAPEVPPEPGLAEKDLTPYRPRLPADAVMELRAGLSQEMGLKIGDKLEFFR